MNPHNSTFYNKINKAQLRKNLHKQWAFMQLTIKKSELKNFNLNCGTEIRLRVFKNECFLHTGPEQLEEKKLRGCWGKSFLFYQKKCFRKLTEDLVRQAEKEYFESLC